MSRSTVEQGTREDRSWLPRAAMASRVNSYSSNDVRQTGLDDTRHPDSLLTSLGVPGGRGRADEYGSTKALGDPQQSVSERWHAK